MAAEDFANVLAFLAFRKVLQFPVLQCELALKVTPRGVKQAERIHMFLGLRLVSVRHCRF